jgi:hypothetical protein
MQLEDSSWSYNEFLAFLMIFGAEMNYPLSKEELEFIRERTKINNIEKIKAKVDSVTDVEGIELIDHYRKLYLNTTDNKDKARHDLEGLLKTEGKHSQIEKAAVHILEKLI